MGMSCCSHICGSFPFNDTLCSSLNCGWIQIWSIEHLTHSATTARILLHEFFSLYSPEFFLHRYRTLVNSLLWRSPTPCSGPGPLSLQGLTPCGPSPGGIPPVVSSASLLAALSPKRPMVGILFELKDSPEDSSPSTK